METKISDLKQRLEKRDQEKEKEREEILKVTRQQRRERDEIPKQPKPNLQLQIQPNCIEKEKTEVQRAVPVLQKEQFTELEKRKINIYFRYRIFSLSKLVEDKVRNNNLIGKAGRPNKSKLLSSNPSNSILSPTGKMQKEFCSNVRVYDVFL